MGIWNPLSHLVEQTPEALRSARSREFLEKFTQDMQDPNGAYQSGVRVLNDATAGSKAKEEAARLIKTADATKAQMQEQYLQNLTPESRLQLTPLSHGIGKTAAIAGGTVLGVKGISDVYGRAQEENARTEAAALLAGNPSTPATPATPNVPGTSVSGALPTGPASGQAIRGNDTLADTSNKLVNANLDLLQQSASPEYRNRLNQDVVKNSLILGGPALGIEANRRSSQLGLDAYLGLDNNATNRVATLAEWDTRDRSNLRDNETSRQNQLVASQAAVKVAQQAAMGQMGAALVGGGSHIQPMGTTYGSTPVTSVEAQQLPEYRSGLIRGYS